MGPHRRGGPRRATGRTAGVGGALARYTSGMPTVHLEVEKKYAADESFELPPLAELVAGSAEGRAAASTRGAPVAEGEAENQRLEATYFDTADLRLATAGLTLRRRTGGDDAGWHLKVPAGSGARSEVRLPLGRATRTVPEALQQHGVGPQPGRRAAAGRRDRHGPDGAPAGRRDRAGRWPRSPTTASRRAGCCRPTAAGTRPAPRRPGGRSRSNSSAADASSSTSSTPGLRERGLREARQRLEARAGARTSSERAGRPSGRRRS